jgi:hypothetical protein
MPKIRDLGINVIPSTMRPPEIGPGGLYAMPQDPCGNITCGDTCGNTVPDCSKAPCEVTCGDTCGPTGVCGRSRGGDPCRAVSKRPQRKKADGLTPDHIAALRQQLQLHMGA